MALMVNAESGFKNSNLILRLWLRFIMREAELAGIWVPWLPVMTDYTYVFFGGCIQIEILSTLAPDLSGRKGRMCAMQIFGRGGSHGPRVKAGTTPRSGMCPIRETAAMGVPLSSPETT